MGSKENPVGTWSEYFASTLDKPLHPLYKKLPLLDRQRALELGAGVGTGVRFLLDQGLRVTAVDAEPEAIEILRQRCPEAEIIESRMEDCFFAARSYNVIVAGFSLFFLDETTYPSMARKLRRWLKPGGYLAAQFLGERDDWASRGYLSHTEEEIREKFGGFDVKHWEEVERDGFVSQGDAKHWHVFHVIFQRKLDAED